MGTAGATPIVQRKPVAYQEVDGEQKRIDVTYFLESKTRVGFKVGPYDGSQPLVIDPVAYSVLFGDNGDNIGHHIAVDASGNAYVAGEVSTGATPQNIDAIVEKYASDGTLLWRSAFHGNQNKDGTDKAFGIAVDAAGEVFVTGTTTSDDFPTTPTAFSGSCGGSPNPGICNGKADAFLMKLSSTTGANPPTILYSTYFGGAYDETANAVAVDAAGFIYITGETGQLPVKGPTFAMHSGASQCQFDAYLAKFDPTKAGPASLVFSTLIGGDGNDEGKALAIAPGQIRLRTPCTRFPCLEFTNVGTIWVAGITGEVAASRARTPGFQLPQMRFLPITVYRNKHLYRYWTRPEVTFSTQPLCPQPVPSD